VAIVGWWSTIKSEQSIFDEGTKEVVTRTSPGRFGFGFGFGVDLGLLLLRLGGDERSDHGLER
jgi:hypothetical protein